MVMARKLASRHQAGLALPYLVAGIALLVITGEEISWGQRIFGWETPEALEEANRQEETNIHNLYGVENLFDVAQLFVGAAGASLPLVLVRRPAIAVRWPTFAALIPPVALIPFFLVHALWRVYRDFGPQPTRYRFAIAEFAEVTELALALGIFLYLVFQLRRLETAGPPSTASGHSGVHSEAQV